MKLPLILCGLVIIALCALCIGLFVSRKTCRWVGRHSDFLAYAIPLAVLVFLIFFPFI